MRALRNGDHAVRIAVRSDDHLPSWPISSITSRPSSRRPSVRARATPRQRGQPCGRSEGRDLGLENDEDLLIRERR
jgi:hypothetical protein